MLRKCLISLILALALCTSALAADNLTVLDSNRIERTLGAKDIGGVKYYQMVLTNSDGSVVDLNDSTGLGVVPHEHPDHGDIHFHAPDVSTDQTFILVDMSDGIHYPHGDSNAVAIHLDDLTYEIDAGTNANYNIYFYYLDNCSVTDCDSHMVYSISGSKASGNSVGPFSVDWNGAGPILKSGTGGTLSSSNMITLNDTRFQTDVGLKSTYDYVNASTYPGDGDLVMIIDMTADAINFSMNLSYHTHDVDHP